MVLFYRFFLGVILIYACIHKISDPASFTEAIRRYDILPEALIHLTAVTLPWAELFCGVLLITGFKTRSAAFVSALLMLAFIFGISVNLVRGNEIDCGCFSKTGTGEIIGPFTLFRDFVLLIMCYAVFVYDKGYGRLKFILEEEA